MRQKQFLSDLGLLSYRSYWAWQILGMLRDGNAAAASAASQGGASATAPPVGLLEDAAEASIMDLVRATSIKPEDILSTLQHMGLIRYITGQHVIAAPPDTVEREFARQNSKPGPVVDPARLHWAPYRDPAIKRDKWSLSAIAMQHGGEG